MKTGIVVLNYNDAKETVNFVNQIKNFKIIDEICVVDNGSNDNSLELLQTLTDVKLIPLTENRGYAAGNNAGLKYLYEQEFVGDMDSIKDTTVEDSIDDIIEILNISEKVLNLLSENPNSWTIDGENIVFSNNSLSNQYDELINSIG